MPTSPWISAVLISTTLGLHAATRVWDGGALLSGNWSSAANWVGDAAPAAGDSLVFPSGPSRLTSTNNFAANTVFSSITFQGDNYQVHGNSITLGGFIRVEAGAGGIVFRPDIRLGAAQAGLSAMGSGEQISMLGDIDLNGKELLLQSVGELACRGVIRGVGTVVSSGSGRTVLGGASPNTYTGDTYLYDGSLELGKYLVMFPSGTRVGRVAVPGNLIVGLSNSSLISDTVVFEASNQLSADSQVTVRSTGELNLNNYSNTILYLRMWGGYVRTGSGKLTVTGNIVCSADADGSVMAGRLGLGPITVFSVELNAVLTVNAVIEGAPTAPFKKQGGGELRLSAANTYEGATTIAAGTLSLHQPQALGVGNEEVSLEGGVLQLVNVSIADRSLSVSVPSTLRVSGANNVWEGSVFNEASLLIETPPNSGLTLSGIVSGTGHFMKGDGGTLRLAGSADNTFTGTVAVFEGTLELNKVVDQQPVLAISGALTIGDNNPSSGGALVRHGGPDQISDFSTVTVNRGGVWNLSGWHDAVGQIRLEGGAVQTLTGVLELRGDVQVDASPVTASLAGNLDLGGASRTFSVADGPAEFDLDVSARVIGGPEAMLVKEGLGTMRFLGSGANVYTGQTVVREGVLALEKGAGVTAVPGAATVGGHGPGASPAVLRVYGDENIANQAVISVDASGQLDLNGQDETIGALTLTGPGNVVTGTGTLILQGNVTVQESELPAMISGNVSLGTVSRTFDVADGLDFYDLWIPANITGGSGAGCIKQGTGGIRLSGVNSFSGPVEVLAGALHVWHSQALGSAVAGTTLADGAGLTLGPGVGVPAEPLTLGADTLVTFYSDNNAWGGDIRLNGLAHFRSVSLSPSEQLELSGAISGPGSLDLQGGTLLLTGAEPNTYAGDTTVSGEGMVLSKGPGVLAIPGTLRIGNGVGTDRVWSLFSGQIADDAAVQVESGGILDLNGNSETVGSLEGNGEVALGGAVLTCGGNDASTVFAGLITGAGEVVKEGTGTLILSGNPTYAGYTHVAKGVLQVNGVLAGSVVDVLAGATLKGTGSVMGAEVRADASLAPGTSSGTFSVAGDVELAGGYLRVELNGPTPGVDYDQLRVSGDVRLTSAVLDLALGSLPAGTETFTILENLGPNAVQGTFEGLPEGAPFERDGYSLEITYVGGDGNDVVLTYHPPSTEVPVLTVAPSGGGQIHLSWTPEVPGFVLQEASVLFPGDWEDAASGSSQPVILNTAEQARFYRLRRP